MKLYDMIILLWDDDNDDDNDNERIKDGIKKKNLPGSDGLMIRSNSKVMMMSVTATLIAGSDL